MPVETQHTAKSGKRAPHARKSARAQDDELRIAVRESSLGTVLVAGSAVGLVAVLLGDDREALVQEMARRFPTSTLNGDYDQATDALAGAVVRLIERRGVKADAALHRELDAEVDMRGTDFQRAVWTALRDIPPGSTATYTDIASQIGRPASVRAVAQACAANPLAVVVPCHRVVRRDGQLAGYRWGIQRKRELLARESEG